MDADRELLVQIRDLLADHVSRQTDWIAQQREIAAKNEAWSALALATQQKQARFTKLVVLVLLPVFVIVNLSLFSGTQ